MRAKAAQSSANFFESPKEKLSRAMAGIARRDRPGGLEGARELAAYLAEAKAKRGLGVVEAGIARHGFDPQGVLKATRAYARSKKVGVWWDVFEGLGRNGVPTFFARPPRIRNPAGGKHVIRRANGKSGMMPNMLNTSPEYGEAGPQVGPRMLFAGLRRAAYTPKLQEPWDRTMDEAIEFLDVAIARELDHALERKSQGRSY